mgnify:CR=1 FL=1
MEDARILLHADLVTGRAHQSAVVHGCDRGVSERAAAKVCHGPPAWHADDLRRVVEGPLELHIRGVGRDRTQHVHNLLLPHAIYHRFRRFTHRNI